MTYLPPEPSNGLATRTDVGSLSDRVDSRFRRVDERLDGIDRRLDGIDQRFDRMERRLETMDDRLHSMHETLRDQMRYHATTSLGAMTALTAIYASLVIVIT